MGNSTYDYGSRTLRATKLGYMHDPASAFKKQMDARRIHESMDPKNIVFREARDSEAHPNSLPIIFALDLTGSMGSIPRMLIADGLPKMISGIIQSGTPDPALLFLGIGDTYEDRYPLQVGQFESGDVELDTWLVRTYLEGGGGGNAGESYSAAWYFAAFHTESDAWDKRGLKGILFTVGDEPCLRDLPANHLTGLMNEAKAQAGYTDSELLTLAQERYHVYHIHVMHSSGAERSLGYWKQLMGENCLEVADVHDIPALVSSVVTRHSSSYEPTVNTPAGETTVSTSTGSPSTSNDVEDML